MKEEIITDNMDENLVIKYNGQAFALVQRLTTSEGIIRNRAMLLNPEEALKIADFIYREGK